LHATQATTEVTNVPIAPPPVRRRTAMFVGSIAVVGIAAAALYYNNAQSAVNTERANSVAKDSSLASVKTAEVPGGLVIPPADTSKRDSSKLATVPPMVDTAKLNARRKSDSIAKVQDGLASSA